MITDPTNQALPAPLAAMWEALSRERDGKEQAVTVGLLLALFCLQQPAPTVALRALSMSAARQIGAPHLRFADNDRLNQDDMLGSVGV